MDRLIEGEDAADWDIVRHIDQLEEVTNRTFDKGLIVQRAIDGIFIRNECDEDLTCGIGVNISDRIMIIYDKKYLPVATTLSRAYTKDFMKLIVIERYVSDPLTLKN